MVEGPAGPAAEHMWGIDETMNNKRSGQAIVELVVALVVILVLTAGLLQIGSMGVHHSRLMSEARREAGRKALLEVSSFASPRFIGACTTGSDGIPFSRDDDTTPGDVALLGAGIVDYAHPDELDRRQPDNIVSVMAGSAFPQELLGLVDGEATTNVLLLPIVRQLIYDRESLPLHGKAWMTWTRGIY